MGFFGKGKRVFDPTQKVTGPHSFRIQGKNITCPHCGNDQFEQRFILLNTPGMTFFNLDWANRTASVLACTRCSHLQWFQQQPEVVA
jgi:predicted nucleic-acid-binding Zn-ribbon protein